VWASGNVACTDYYHIIIGETLPTKVMQTITEGPKANCFQACLASYFSVPIDCVHEIEDDDKWSIEIENWAREFDLGFLVLSVPNSEHFCEIHRGYSICSGIYKDGRLWHDPHPESNGIKSVEYVDFFYPLNPLLWFGNMTLMLTGR
jgi:hypothetical protein